MSRPTACVLMLLSLLFVRPDVALATAPGAAVPIAPSGDVSAATISFSWQSESTSTWYLFWLGKGTPTALVMQTWYTAEQAHCASGGTCTITVTPPVNAGGHTWFVQTWNASGTGPWSTGMVFSMKDPVANWSARLPDARRFTLVLSGEAVLDNETGVVWDRTPQLGTGTLQLAQSNCAVLSRGGRRGWRLPTFAELTSLVDGAFALPAGHPFTVGASPTFWSQTGLIDSTSRWLLIVDSTVGFTSPGSSARSWCVRSESPGFY
jgi:hypothetical protein